LVNRHNLSGHELFVFTDNSTAEAAFWKGSLTSRKLFELVLRLRFLEIKHDLKLHVIHASGRRMIEQGTDGLSRADEWSGVMRGRPMLDYIPLDLSALDREPTLLGWLKSATSGVGFEFLNPEGRFGIGHGRGNFIWTPPPAAAEVAVEQLGKARLKRPGSMHLVVVPRMMTGRWRRLMIRGTDAYFRLGWKDVWPLGVHMEPSLI
jgi:hypothetical protein